VKAPAKKAAAKKAAPKKAEAAASTADDPRPALLTDAPSGAADDLKKISGVGPKLEQTLNELGVWKYEQVAQFTAKEIAWVDERLRFKGRIERDDWVGQAKTLAEGKS
jgi:NADH-quinone oxidoreductase subunit E